MVSDEQEIKPQLEAANEDVQVVMQQDARNSGGGSNTWFYIAVLVMLGLVIYYIYTSIEELKDPLKWFSYIETIGGVMHG